MLCIYVCTSCRLLDPYISVKVYTFEIVCKEDVEFIYKYILIILIISFFSKLKRGLCPK